MKNQVEEVIEKHFKLLLQELDDKNIIGVRLVKQGNKIMLLFDKTLLSRANQQILNAINVVYPNIIVSINDSENPFDYEELYASVSEKVNKKVRPYDLYDYSVQHQNNVTEYFDQFRFTGIELDEVEISTKPMQFGYFLEFINALQEQDSIRDESLEVLDKDTINRHEHYVRNGRPDKKHIALWVKYNEELIEYSNGLKVANDPYLSNLFIIVLNKKEGSINKHDVHLNLERINQNVKEYLRRKVQGGEEQRLKRVSTTTFNSQIEEDGEVWGRD